MRWRKTITDKALGYLGLMKKAGKLEIGEMSTTAAVKAGRARLLLLASDTSENTKNRVNNLVKGRRVLLIKLPYSKNELGDSLGKVSACSMAATTDFGLSSAFLQKLAEAEPSKYSEAAEEMKQRAEKAEKRKAAGKKKKPGREQNGI